MTPNSLEPQAAAGTSPARQSVTQTGDLIRQTQAALHESQERYHALIQTANDAIISIDNDGMILDWNRGAEQIFGYPEYEVKGQPLTTIIPLHYRDRHLAGMARLQNGGEMRSSRAAIEMEGLRKTGEVFPVELSLSEWEAAPGHYYTAIIRDITERKRTEAELRYTLSELQVLYDNGLAISALQDPREIGRKIIETLAKNLAWHHIAIRLRRGESDELELIAFNQPGLDEQEAIKVEQQLNTQINKIGQGLSGWSMKIGQAIRSGVVQSDPHYADTYPGIHSGIYMPLAVGDRVIGCISVESEQSNAFTEQDERLLATLARQTAIAFENVRLYQDIQQQLRERERAEAELRQSEARFRSLFENSIEGVALHEIVLDERREPIDYIFLMANPGFESNTGLHVADILGKRVTQVYPGIEKTDLIKIYGKVALTGEPTFFEIFLETTQQHFKVTAYQVGQGRFAAVFENITEKKLAEEALRASLAEKEILLREVHHRVKNNLASINGLINLQQETLADPAVVTEFSELSGRIHSMALVHELLYRSETLSRIDLDHYLQTLISHIHASYDPSARIKLDVASRGVEMDLDSAIPCGLIVNELVTNAFKYAFPDGKPRPGQSDCRITVTASWDGSAYNMTVSDNGAGLPANFDWKTSKSLGLQLVTLLGQRQLRGQMELDCSDGTAFRLRFAPKHPNGR